MNDDPPGTPEQDDGKGGGRDYMMATGILTIHLALSGVRDGSPIAWIVAAAAGGASVGLMAVVNVVLRSDFRWPLLGLASLWTAATLLAAFGV